MRTKSHHVVVTVTKIIWKSLIENIENYYFVLEQLRSNIEQHLKIRQRLTWNTKIIKEDFPIR